MKIELINAATRQPYRSVVHNGIQYIATNEGDRYEIHVPNRYSTRLEVVVSVDGRDVISGELARRDAPGYVIEPSSTCAIKGWRTDHDNVAAFVFTDTSAGFAQRMGDSGSSDGLIGIAYYNEVRRLSLPDVPLSFGGGGSDLATRGMATGFGESQASPVREVQFERASRGNVHQAVYGSLDALARLGVPIERLIERDPWPGERAKKRSFAAAPPSSA